MKAEELRIGNLIAEPYDNITEVVNEIVANTKSDGSGEINGEIEDYFNPIPLTEEWLLKFGFTKYDNGCISAKFCIGKNPITHDYLFELTWLKDYTDVNFEPHPFYKNGYHQIKYIHQLQNLYFALTGQELEVKI